MPSEDPSPTPPLESPAGALEFAGLGLMTNLAEALSALGYEEPTPVQREAIPPLLSGRDLMAQAATGTGKTAAFALPLLQRLSAGGEPSKPFGLVLVPTRELAIQVAEAMHRYGEAAGARVLAVYGGQPYGKQLRALRRGVHVVVATPGRALDHIRRETLDLSELSALVLDEADEMLDMGFAEELDAIVAETPRERQTALFSATIPSRIRGLAKRYLRDPVRVEIDRRPPPEGERPRVRQTAYIVRRADKPAALGRVLDVEDPDAALVFCRTRSAVDELTQALSTRGYRCEALHGGIAQDQRDRVMNRLRTGAAELIVATDVAARGLDVPQLTHVVNFDAPPDPHDYLHRIGRVGRAGRSGVAVTLAEPREHKLLRSFGALTKQKIIVSNVPTVADLRARRLELTRASIRDAILEGDLEPYRPIIESLTDEFDVVEVALAAIKRAHEKMTPAGEDEEEIAPVPPERERPPPAGKRRPKAKAPRGKQRGPGAGSARLFIGLGREAGVRPQDLVGAITGEAGISGREVGAIDIADRYSLVEVDERVAENVVNALRGALIKGRRAPVRRARRPA